MADTFINLTPAAVDNMTRLMADNDMAGFGLRFGVRGGGCSGYSYLLEFSDGPEEGDMSLQVEGINVFVPPLKRDFVKGCTINFVDELMETGFKIHNPNVQRTCGCGESFEIAEGDKSKTEATATA